MLSVNQLNAQIKLVEMWKSENIADYPLKINHQSADPQKVCTRADKIERPIEVGKSDLTRNTCISDAIRLWNRAPLNVTSCLTVQQAKKEIKLFVRSLPI